MSDAKAAATKGPLRRTQIVRRNILQNNPVKFSQNLYCEFTPDEVIVRQAYFSISSTGAPYYVTTTLVNDPLCMLVDDELSVPINSKHTTKGIQISGAFDFTVFDFDDTPTATAAGESATIMLTLEFVKY